MRIDDTVSGFLRRKDQEEISLFMSLSRARPAKVT